ncbi:hypothetical protein [Hymenobacter chitinivorans]|uniref:Uncharacterized protein n=1 Tax=Hymenobacter chitinivorans DSM 11115 TaxID=1121954 RepID=A0A2M9BLW2_9BACT|nr:hypothetical protein [Hymenobacter chitinivorans]PJJ58946.1 hypothetical protein CLV45_0358 [Hymenobacter chitinivorans DSM 11115]
MCDEATAEIDFQIKTYTTQEAQSELTDTCAKWTATRKAAKLVKMNARIASQDILLATPGLDAATLQEATNERAALLVQRTGLSKTKSLASGVTRFFIGVDTELMAQQVAKLTTVKQGIAVHRDTLSA